MHVIHRPIQFILKLFKHLSLIFLSGFCVLPLITCVFAAFKTSAEFAATSKVASPASWANVSNFISFWQDSGIGQGFATSLLVMAVVISLSVMMGAMLAFVLNRFRFFGNNLIRNAFLMAALIPGIAMQVTVYKIMIPLNLVDTLYGYMFLMIGTDVISIYILLQFFENLSDSLDESAIIEGCTYYGVFLKSFCRCCAPRSSPALY